MDLIFGKTQLETEDCHVVVSLDKCDRCTLVLGINRVEIVYVDGSWTVVRTGNVVSQEIPRTDPNGFVEVSANLQDLLLSCRQ